MHRIIEVQAEGVQAVHSATLAQDDRGSREVVHHTRRKLTASAQPASALAVLLTRAHLQLEDVLQPVHRGSW